MESVSPNPREIPRKAALDHACKNRSDDFLPGKFFTDQGSALLLTPVSVGDRWRVKLGDVQNYIHAVYVNVCIYIALFQGSLADLYTMIFDFSVRKAVVKDYSYVNG